MQKTVGYRIKNVLLALLVFVVMIELPALTSGIVLGVIEGLARANGGSRAVAEAYLFLIDNLNLFSAGVYVLFGIPVLIWVVVQRRRGRRAERARAAQAAHVPQVAATGLPAQVPAASIPAAFPAQAPATPGLAGYYEQQPVVPPSVSRGNALAGLPEQISFRVRGVARSAWFDAAFLGIGMQFVTTFIMILVMVLLPAAMEEYQELVGDSGLLDYGIMWFISTIVLPPLVEETGFRGLGLTYLKRAGVPFVVANVLQALAFGLFHGNLVQGIYTFVLGLFMGYVAHRSGSVVPAMLMHAVYNLMGTLGSDVLYTLVPWLPFWVELAVGAVLSLGAMISLHDRGGRPAASS